LSDRAVLPQTAVLGFSLGSLGAGVYSTVPTVLLLFFCTEVLRIPAAVAATIVFLPKAWAILWDPLVGAWSDRSRSRRGRRAPFILAGSVGVASTFALLFNVPELPATATIAYVMTIYFLMASAYSLFAVPYVAVPAEISDIPSERERLMLWRMVFAMGGVLVGAGAAPHIAEWAGGGRGGYGAMAMIIAAGCGLAMLTTYISVRRHHLHDCLEEKPRTGLRQGLARVMANGPYVRLWFVYLLALSGAAMFTAMVPYFVTRVLGQSEGDAGSALLAMLCGTILSLPAWSAGIRRINCGRLLGIAILAYALVAGTFILVPMNLSTAGAALLYFLLGVPFAGLQLLPFVMLAHIAHDDARTGIRQEGLFTGLWTAGEKLALAIGPAAAGIGLAWAGYVAGGASQTPQTLAALRTAMAAGPAVFMLPALLVLLLWRFGKVSEVVV